MGRIGKVIVALALYKPQRRQASGQFFQQNVQFEPGQRRSQAIVDPVAKRHMLLGICSSDIEVFSVLEMGFIPVGGGEHHQKLGVFRYF